MSGDDKKDGPKAIGELIPKLKELPSLKKSKGSRRTLEQRLFDFAEADAGKDPSEILYQHSVLCQTCLPYRDPGTDVRLWTRKNGYVRLEVQAGRAYDSRAEDFVDVGLPFGPKPRLVLYHLNAEALRKQSPEIELEDSLTAFVKRTLGLDSHGRNIRVVKEQLARLSAADFRIGTTADDRSITLKGSIVEGFELWTPKDERQRILWPTRIHFSQRYFESLMKHAVPLNEAAVALLAHNAMALDIYTWLAQRLHRVDAEKGAVFVPWTGVKEHFGDGYGRMDNFKRVFRLTLGQVKAVYPEAKFGVDDRGMELRHSRPPVGRRRLLDLKPE
jgi:hypothetical protein